jgi:nitrilase
MKHASEPFLVAAIQGSPVFLDRKSTLERACALIAEAAEKGARLVVFPEGYLPGYPFWVWFIPSGNTKALRELYTELLDNSVSVPDAATERLCAAARDAGVTVVMGLNERNAEASGATLYNSLLFIGPHGEILGCHRKLVPTVGERVVHGQGDGSTLRVYDVPVGRLSGLICWENYMPLARFALYAGGTQIHVAPTWDRGEPWLSTLRHIAKEGRVYVIGCCSAMRREDVPDDLTFKEEFLPAGMEWINPGGSAIVDPDGRWVTEPVMESQEILYGKIDPQFMQGPRFQLDVAGHYGRPDVFQLTVDRQPRPVVRDAVPKPAEPVDSDSD